MPREQEGFVDTTFNPGNHTHAEGDGGPEAKRLKLRNVGPNGRPDPFQLRNDVGFSDK